jgi:hypothetical protein
MAAEFSALLHKIVISDKKTFLKSQKSDSRSPEDGGRERPSFAGQNENGTTLFWLTEEWSGA